MIESLYWKEELLRIAKSLQPVKHPARWSVRAHCIIERDLMIGFFLLRRLIELHKVSSRTKGCRLNVFSYKANGKRVTRLNGSDVPDLYDTENEIAESKALTYISNQFVHAYTSFIFRDKTRNWSDVYLVSDFDRNNCIWRVPVAEITRIFFIAAEDYPARVSMIYNAPRGDYDVATD